MGSVWVAPQSLIVGNAILVHNLISVKFILKAVAHLTVKCTKEWDTLCGRFHFGV